MAGKTSIADAYLAIIPSLEGSQSTITSELGKTMGTAGDEAGKTAGEKAGSSMAVKLGAVLAAVGIGKIIGDAFSQGMDLEKSTDVLQASLNLTQDQSEQAGKIAGQLYADAYGDSMDDVTEAVGAVMSSISGMSDASDGDLQSVTEGVMNMASAFDMDVPEAAAAAGRAITSGLADDGTSAVDLLTASLQDVPSAMRGDIVDAANEYGGYLTGLGLTGQESMGLLVDASANGQIAIDKTGDALKELSIRATDGSTTTQAAYDAMGLSAMDMSNDLLAGGDTARGAFDKIVDGLLSIEDPTTQANTAISLFGTPLEDLGTAQIPDFLNSLDSMDSSLGDTSGSAAALGDTLNSNTSTSLEEVQRSFQQVLTSGVTPLLGPLDSVLQWMTNTPGVLTAVTVALGVLAVGLGVAAAAQWVMNSALLANPVTWIIVGIMALIAAIVLLATNWDTVVAWINGVGNSFLEWWNGLWASVGAWVSQTWDSITTWVTEKWTALITGVQLIGAAFIDWWNNLWATVGNFLSEKWDAMIAWVTGIPDRFMAGLAALGQLGAQFAAWVGGANDAAVNKFNELVSWVTGIPGSVLGALGSVGSLLWDAGSQIISGLWDGLKSKFEDVKGWVSGVGDWIADHKGPKAYDLALLVPNGGWIMDGLNAGLTSGFSDVLGNVSGMAAQIRDEIDGATINAATASSLAAAVPAYKAGNVAPAYWAGGARFEQTNTVVAQDPVVAARFISQETRGLLGVMLP